MPAGTPGRILDQERSTCDGKCVDALGHIHDDLRRAGRVCCDLAHVTPPLVGRDRPTHRALHSAVDQLDLADGAHSTSSAGQGGSACANARRLPGRMGRPPRLVRRPRAGHHLLAPVGGQQRHIVGLKREERIVRRGPTERMPRRDSCGCSASRRSVTSSASAVRIASSR